MLYHPAIWITTAKKEGAENRYVSIVTHKVIQKNLWGGLNRASQVYLYVYIHLSSSIVTSKLLFIIIQASIPGHNILCWRPTCTFIHYPPKIVRNVVHHIPRSLDIQHVPYRGRAADTESWHLPHLALGAMHFAAHAPPGAEAPVVQDWSEDNAPESCMLHEAPRHKAPVKITWGLSMPVVVAIK